MIMGGRRPREADHQADRLRDRHPRPNPHMPILARIIMNSRAFQRLMERLDTREGVLRENPRTSKQPAPLRPSDPIMPEKASFYPRMPPLGGMVFRSRIVQRLLGNPFDRTNARSSLQGSGPAETRIDQQEENQSRESERGQLEDYRQIPPGQDRKATEADIRELRRKALISSLLKSTSRREGQ